MKYSPSHNVVIYNVDIPERVINCIPTAKKLSTNQVIVPHNIQSAQVMQQLGHTALSPILTEYDWPGKYKPFDHQKEMAAFFTLNPRAFNLSDMGTGKTLAVLWALDYLMTKGIIKKALIVTPLSTLWRVWHDECFTAFMSRRNVSILYGSREKRIESLNRPADIYIVNHDGIGVGSTRGPRGMVAGELAERLRECKDFDAIIVDEGSAFKESGTNKYKILRYILANKSYVWWLTGTPTPNAPTDAWAQAKLVRRDYNESYIGFRDRTMRKISNFKWVPQDDSEVKAAKILQPSIRFNRDDCLDLPDVIVETRDAELSSDQKKAYDSFKKTLAAELSGKQITAINEAGLRLKLIQIACGAIYGEEKEIHKLDAAPRLKVLQEVIEEAGQKILIFAPFRSVVNMLYNELRKHYSVEIITGDTSAKERSRIFSDFQCQPSPRIIVADPRTMAHGLTLTAASTTVWYGPIDQPEIYQQANKRMDRPGQKHKMCIVRLAGTPIEREIYKRLDSKQTMQGIILDLVKEN